MNFAAVTLHLFRCGGGAAVLDKSKSIGVRRQSRRARLRGRGGRSEAKPPDGEGCGEPMRETREQFPSVTIPVLYSGVEGLEERLAATAPRVMY